MSFDWKNYVYLAEILLDTEKESYLRSSFSRAYYGVFCTASNKKGYKNYTGPDVHRKVISEYKNSTTRLEKDVGRILDKLRRSRNNADYNEDRPLNPELTERIVAYAKDILTQING